jgi:hypothetical protein
MRTVLAALSLTIVVTTAGCRPSAPKNPEPAPVTQGEPKKDPPKADAPKQDSPPEAFKKPPIRGGSIVRRVNEADVMQMMNQLKVAVTSFQLDRNRYPSTREEFEAYYEKNAKINEALKDGDLVFVWKARKTDDPSKAILAYEGQPDTLGRRVILLANGDIKTIDSEEFKALEKSAK